MKSSSNIKESTSGVVSGDSTTAGVVVGVVVAVVVGVEVAVVEAISMTGSVVELDDPPDPPDDELGATITGSTAGGVVSMVEVATGSSGTDSVVVAVVLAVVDSGVVVAISVDGRSRTADSDEVEVPARSSAPIVFATRLSDEVPLLFRAYKSTTILPIPTQAPRKIGQKPILVCLLFI